MQAKNTSLPPLLHPTIFSWPVQVKNRDKSKIQLIPTTSSLCYKHHMIKMMAAQKSEYNISQNYGNDFQNFSVASTNLYL